MTKIPPHVQKLIFSMVYDFQRDPLSGASLLDLDTEFENTEFLRFEIKGPDSTPYSNGSFEIKIVFSDSFPQAPPKAYFKTPIFHPNVQEKSGEICISSLKKDWKPKNPSLKNILLCIFSLLHYPNPQSALNAEAASLLQENYDLFCNRARSLTNIHARQKQRGKKHPNKLFLKGNGKKLANITDEAFQVLSTKSRKHNTLNRSVGKRNPVSKTRKGKGGKKRKKTLRRL